jgi:integrase
LAGRPYRGRVRHGPSSLCREAAGLGCDWQPRETRHSFVSIASDHGASIEDIADAAGHVNPNVTRAVYRHQISDTVTRAPAALDQALAAGGEA